MLKHDCSRQRIIAKVKVLDRPQTAIPAHFDIIYTSCNDHDTSCAVTKLTNKTIHHIETSVLKIF